jgi:zinc transport system substrate-binding protein
VTPLWPRTARPARQGGRKASRGPETDPRDPARGSAWIRWYSPRRARAAAGLGLAFVSVALTACDQGASPPGSGPDRLLVIASFYPLYDFVRHVAGDDVDVVSLVPPGVEPHDWEPSPHDLAEVRRARLLVYNGAGLEPWVERVLRDVAGTDLVVVNATRGLALVTDQAVDDDGRSTGTPGIARRGTAPVDPHVWLDPVLAISQVEAIRAGLQQADPVRAATYEVNAVAYVARLRALDAAYAGGLRDCARRDVVTAHAAFGYLTRRYGLTQVPVLGVLPEAEPSPADLARLIQAARRRGVRAVFAETILNRRLTEALAREVGAEVLVLNPLEGLTAEEQAAGKDYLSVMEENLRALRAGLGCR